MDLLGLAKQFKMKIHGVIHIGAHHLEEYGQYAKMGVPDDNIIWIEADPLLVQLTRAHFPSSFRIYQAAIAEADGRKCTFNISSNTGASSSILAPKTHLTEHPYVKFGESIPLTTSRLDTFLSTHGIPPNIANFLNIDIQGAELLAFQGIGAVLDNIDYIAAEINECELYEGCGLVDQVDDYLTSRGFTRVFTHMEVYGWGDALYIRSICRRGGA
jgi:FkbM family methyltransferase